MLRNFPILQKRGWDYMLSKKYYEDIADIISSIVFLDGDDIKDLAEYRIIPDSLERRLSDYFKKDNPNFNKRKFIDRCQRSRHVYI